MRRFHRLIQDRDKVLELKQKFENFYVLNIGQEENKITGYLALRGYCYTSVDWSIHSHQEILGDCRFWWSSRICDGGQKIHHIIDTIWCYIHGSYCVVEDLSRELNQRMRFRSWCDGHSVQNSRLDNNVHCFLCLIFALAKTFWARTRLTQRFHTCIESPSKEIGRGMRMKSPSIYHLYLFSTHSEINDLWYEWMDSSVEQWSEWKF